MPGEASFGSWLRAALPTVSADRRTSGHFDRANIDFSKSISNMLATALGRREFRHRALNDALPGLANRTLFVNRLDQAIQRSQRHGTKVAVLLLEVDGFKRINNCSGHRAGDELLTSI